MISGITHESAIPTPSVRRACASHFRSATGHRPEQQADRGHDRRLPSKDILLQALARRALLSFLWRGGSACLRSARSGRLSDGLVDEVRVLRRLSVMRDAYTRSRFVPLQVTGSKPTKSSKLSFDPQVTGSKPMKSLFKTALKHRSRRRIYSYHTNRREKKIHAS